MKVDLRVDGTPVSIEMEQVDGHWRAKVGERTYHAHLEDDVVHVDGHPIHVNIDGAFDARIEGTPHHFEIANLAGVAGADAVDGGAHGPVFAPMTGKVETIEVKQGQAVQAGDVLFVLEAMKMRNQVTAPAAGIVTQVHVEAGANVDTRTRILELEPEAN